MARKLIQTKATTLAYGINDSATTMRLTNLLKLDGTSVSALNIGDLLYGTFDPGTSREEIFSIVGSNVTVNADGTIDITSVARGLKEVDPYDTGGFKTDHPAGAVVVFGNNPQVYAQFGKLADANIWALLNTFTLLPRSTGGSATDPTELITYAQALALATGTASINRVVVAGNGGETILVGQLLYLNVADGEWYLCDADTAGTVDNIILGIAQGAGTNGTPVINGILLFGLDSNQVGLTTNTAYFASNTAGGISSTVGTIEVSVGISRSTTSLLFYPRYNQQLTENQQDALLGNNGTPSDTNRFVTQTGLQKNTEKYAADAGANDTYVITLSPVPTSYTTGMVVHFKANTVNTGDATINVNSLGAKTIVKGVSTTLLDGDIAALSLNTLIYDGTNFVLQNPVANNPIPPTLAQPISVGVVVGNGSVMYGTCISTGFSTTEPFFVGASSSTGAPRISRWIKRRDGSVVMTHSVGVTAASTNTTIQICVVGSFVYVLSSNGGTPALSRYSKTDLTGETTMTVSGTAFTVNTSIFSDGTSIYNTYTAGTVRVYSISGTTVTSGATPSFTSSETQNGFWSDGTFVYSVSAAGTTHRWAVAGGARTVGTTFPQEQFFTAGGAIQGNFGGIFKESGNTTDIYITLGVTTTTACVGKLVPITNF